MCIVSANFPTEQAEPARLIRQATTMVAEAHLRVRRACPKITNRRDRELLRQIAAKLQSTVQPLTEVVHALEREIELGISVPAVPRDLPVDKQHPNSAQAEVTSYQR